MSIYEKNFSFDLFFVPAISDLFAGDKKEIRFCFNQQDLPGCVRGHFLPNGVFAKSDLENSGSGFAAQGFLGQVNLDWLGKNDFGLAVQYTFQRNPLKSSVKNDTLPGMTGPFGTGSWTSHYLLAGLVFMKFIHKVYFEGRALIGVVLSSSPIFNTIDPVYKTQDLTQVKDLHIAFNWVEGTAVSPRVSVKANIEYIVGNPAIHHQYGAQDIA